MIKNVKLSVFTVLLFSFILFFCVGCNGDTKIELREDGSVAFEFEGNIGGIFKDMVASMDEGGGIDFNEVHKDLLLSGFSDVSVSADDDVIKISFVDKKRESLLFELGIVSVKDDEVFLSITPENFLGLYNSSGEEFQMIFDLFLSPVLNDEVMDEEEYIDTINVTYGEEAGGEIDISAVKFAVIGRDGSRKNRNVFVKNILCGQKISF